MKRIIVLGLTIFLSFSLSSQNSTSLKPDYLSYGLLDGKTILKFNLLGAAVRNYSFYAERILSKKVDISKQQVKLSRAQALPKLSAGYYSERILGEKLQGAVIGISIPLWENRNTVKQAKAGVLSSESALEDSRIQFYNRLQSLFNQSVGLREAAQKYRDALSSYSNEPLLRKSLDAGEISLLDYLLEVEFYYDAFNNMLEVERDYALAVAELTAIEL
jgi:outer membrane protein TolC